MRQRVVGADIIYRGHCTAIHLLRTARHSPFTKVLQIGVYGLGRVICQKRIADSQPVQFFQERKGAGKEGGTQINGSIHIQGQMLYPTKPLFNLLSHSARLVWK